MKPLMTQCRHAWRWLWAMAFCMVAVNAQADSQNSQPAVSVVKSYKQAYRWQPESMRAFVEHLIRVSRLYSSGSSSDHDDDDDDDEYDDDVNKQSAFLKHLIVTPGTLDPVFAKATTNYKVNVDDTVNAVAITAIPEHKKARVYLNGTKLSYETRTAIVNLVSGENRIVLRVRSADKKNFLEYVVIVVRGVVNRNNANLNALSLSAGTLDPTFSAAVTAYTASVANTVTELRVTATAQDNAASLTVNGVATASGTPSAPIALNVGVNLISIIVTAADKTTTKTYTVSVTRAAPSNNANLSALSVSAGALNPAFSANVTNYSVNAANNVTTTTVTATLADAGARLTINGQPTPSGMASAPIDLAVGTNLISIVVTAADNTTTKTYTVSITRAASGNADLTQLSLSSGSLVPSFAPNITSYTANVPNNVTSIQVTATAAATGASIMINGQVVASGSPSAPINLNVGNNTITVLVTAPDNVTTKVYSVTVQRAASGNADLSALLVSNGALNPAFASAITNYSVDVANAVTSIQVTATSADSGASIMINGQRVNSGTPSGPIALQVGANSVTVLVTAADTVSTKVYTISVNRAASGNADLSALSFSANPLNPAFSPAVTSYSVSVGNAVTSVTVTATIADANAKVTINGQAATSGTPSAPIILNVGSNLITIVVTAADNSTTKTYTINATRAVSADLSALSLSAGVLNPAFTAANTSYAAVVESATSSLTVTATAQDTNATIRINGVVTASGTPSAPIALNFGTTAISIAVTAADGITVKTYTVIVTRPANANLSSLTISVGTLNPVFSAAQTSYTAQVGYLASVVRVTMQSEDPNASVTVNGVAVVNGVASAPVLLNEGNNTITVEVTAVDGVTKRQYQISMTRQALATFAESVYVKSSNSDTNDVVGSSVAVWGNTVVVGASGEASNAVGINGDQNNNLAPNSGAVYVFVRDAGGIWTQQAYLKASNTQNGDSFGASVALWRDTLVVGATGEDSNATGVNGNQSDNTALESGAAYVFVRDVNGVWVQQAYLKASNTTTLATLSTDAFGGSVAIHENTIVVGAHLEDSDGVGVNGSQTSYTAGQSGAAYVFTRSGASWTQQAYLKSSNSQAGDNFGISVAVFANRIAVGAIGEDSAAVGVNGNQLDNSKQGSGAVYVFERSPADAWTQTAYIKASNSDSNDNFGQGLALWANTLVVGAPNEASNSVLTPADNSTALAGAAYVFDFANGNWSQSAYLKAAVPDFQDFFGGGKGISLWENTLVVSAGFEDSNAIGINGDPVNNAAASAGAAFVFIRNSEGVWVQRAYVKASNTRSGDVFGSAVGVWGDTMVSGAQFEDGFTRGLYSTPAFSRVNSGASYIYR